MNSGHILKALGILFSFFLQELFEMILPRQHSLKKNFPFLSLSVEVA